MVRESVTRQVHLGARLPDSLALSQKNLRAGHADHRIGSIGPDQRTVQQGYTYAEASKYSASEIDVDFDKELKQLVQKGGLLKSEGREVEKLLMNNNPEAE